ncbi:MAG: hypothetical protein HY873_02330 [Chloroflexi bacterium]|nr:hypothetical protein [Chloroflexota bacterium]
MLAKIGYLTLLRDLFGSVLIPQSVYAESIARDSAVESAAFALAVDDGWIRIVPDPEGLPAGSGRGERAALAIASGLHADLIVIDDLAARKQAIAAGLPITGTVGVLRRAIDAKLIAGGDHLVSMLVGVGFRATDELLNQLG